MSELTIDTKIALILDAEVGELRQKINLAESGMELLLAAVKSGDPREEIVFRIQEELRQIGR